MNLRKRQAEHARRISVLILYANELGRTEITMLCHKKGKIMKKLLILIIMLLATPVFAAPYLVCDEDASVDSYLVSMDSGSDIETPAPLHFDLDGIDVGNHHIEVKAKNLWGVSSPSPLDFSKQLPGSPSGLGLQEN